MARHGANAEVQPVPDPMHAGHLDRARLEPPGPTSQKTLLVNLFFLGDLHCFRTTLGTPLLRP